MCEVRVQITDQGNHPQKIVEDIKKCIMQSLSIKRLNLGDTSLSEFLARKLKQNVITGDLHK